MIPVVSDSDCNKNYGGGITSNMICAGLLNVGGKGACQVRHKTKKFKTKLIRKNKHLHIHQCDIGTN